MPVIYKKIVIGFLFIALSNFIYGEETIINNSLKIDFPGNASICSNHVMDSIYSWTRTADSVKYTYTVSLNKIGEKFQTTTILNEKQLTSFYRLLAKARRADETTILKKKTYLLANTYGIDTLGQTFVEQIIYANRSLIFLRCQAHTSLNKLKANTFSFFNFTLTSDLLAKSQFDKRSSLIFLIPLLLSLFCIASIAWYGRKIYKFKRLLR